MKFLNIFKKKSKRQQKKNVTEASMGHEGYSYEYNDGSKFYNGFGATKLFLNDYFTLRERSNQLFKENIYARGLIRRLVTNEINTGLTPEVIPNENLLGLEEDSLAEWSETVEDRFEIWAANPKLCDTKRLSDFGMIERSARAEALISGDVLIALRLDRLTGLPRVQLISGANVITPPGTQATLQNGITIQHGVEINKFGQHLAYHVVQDDGNFVRIPSSGARSGRKVAWLVYGTDRRINEVRGEPLLSIVMQSIKEIDRYRDAVQRKAAINAMLAMFIKKSQDKIGTKPITNGAVRKANINYAEADGTVREYKIRNQIPGMVIEDLQVGEEPVAFGNQGTDTKFSEFEAAIIHAIAWANEVPPEILQLAFSSNYSASQAAINEFKNYLNKIRSEFGATFCKPIYQEWLISEVLSGKITANGFLAAWRDPLQYDIYGAWVMSEWSGAIKPSTDIKKQAQGYQLMLENGWITRDRAAKELTGTKFSRNIRTIRRENAQMLDAGFSIPNQPDTINQPENNNEADEADEADEDVGNKDES